jgi:4,5-dihydroxyphthalate decarboxylase
MKERLRLTLACTLADQTRDFTQGSIEAEGIDITYLPLDIPEMFHRFIVNREFDVSEMSFGRYIALRAQGDTGITAIPVFPSRVFRHSAIFVRRDGPVHRPEELRGRRIGVPEWPQTATVYARALLTHEYGVPLSEIAWVQGGVTEPGREDKLDVQPAPGVRLERIADRSLDEMLRAGAIDALITADPPPSFGTDPNVVRLFADFPAVERAYYQKTGIFPIMHVIGVRTTILDAHPWAARSLYKAFDEAKRASMRRFDNVSVACYPLPWIVTIGDEVRRAFGEDWWPYGIEPNRTTIDAFLSYAAEQGVTRRRLIVDELFPETMRGGFRV